MATGFKSRVMLACVEYDVMRVVEPIKSYSPDIFITFHNAFSDNNKNPLKMEFLNEVEKKVIEYNPKTRYHSFDDKIYDFASISATIETFIELLNKIFDSPDILINISTGTNIFSAAATMSSMIHPNVRIFSVKDIETNIEDSVIKTACYIDNIPVGTAKTISQPYEIPVYNVNPPERNLVLGLRLLDECQKAGRNPMAKEMIELLRKNDLWMRPEPNSNDGVFYLRDYVDKWIANGWVVRGQLRNRYAITDKGRMIIETFYNRSDVSL